MLTRSVEANVNNRLLSLLEKLDSSAEETVLDLKVNCSTRAFLVRDTELQVFKRLVLFFHLESASKVAEFLHIREKVSHADGFTHRSESLQQRRQV